MKFREKEFCKKDSDFSNLKGFDKMLTRGEVAQILGVSERQVYRLEQRGCLPKVHLTKNIVRYLPKDLEKLIEDRRIEYN